MVGTMKGPEAKMINNGYLEWGGRANLYRVFSESDTKDVAVADSITQNYPEEQSFHFCMNPDTLSSNDRVHVHST